MRSLSREILTIIDATIALAALILTGTAGVRGEFQAVRDELRTEARTNRESFQSHILRLTEPQGVLIARVDGLRAPPAPNP